MNIYALGRATQVLEGYTGPVLGVKYSVTIADQRKREELKEAARKRQQEEYEIYGNNYIKLGTIGETSLLIAHCRTRAKEEARILRRRESEQEGNETEYRARKREI